MSNEQIAKLFANVELKYQVNTIFIDSYGVITYRPVYNEETKKRAAFDTEKQAEIFILQRLNNFKVHRPMVIVPLYKHKS